MATRKKSGSKKGSRATSNPKERARKPRADVDAETGGDGAQSPGPRFEESLQQLEEVVGTLERGDLELEESLAVFEQGVGHAKRCAAQLEDAERRIEVLMREGGEWLQRPINAGDADGFDGDPVEEER